MATLPQLPRVYPARDFIPVASLILVASGCQGIRQEDFTVLPYGKAVEQPSLNTLPEGDHSATAPPPAAAQLTSIGLRSCIQLAFKNNRDLRQTRSALERAGLEMREAEATIFEPRLTASYAALDESASTRLGLKYASKYGVEVEPFVRVNYNDDSSPSKETEAGISISRRLFNLAENVRLRLPITRAQRSILSGANRYRRETRELAFTVTRSFFAIQRAQARLKVRQNRVKDAKEFLEVISNRVKNGFAAPVDEVNARINLNQAELGYISETTNLRNAKEALLALFALEVKRELSISPEDVSIIPDVEVQVEPDVEFAKRYHERLVNQRLDIDLSDKEIRVQGDLLRPQVTLGVTPQLELQGDRFFGSATDDDNVTINISYSASLDGKKAEKARLAQLERQQRERLLALRQSETDLETRLRALARRIDELKIRIGLAAERLNAERRKLDATIKRYESGNVDNLEVTRAKQELDNAEIGLLDARVDLHVAIAEYRSILPPAPPGPLENGDIPLRPRTDVRAGDAGQFPNPDEVLDDLAP